MGKKNKKEINKKRTKAKQVKEKKRKFRLAESGKAHSVQVVHRPGISEMGAPQGFRAIGMSQAVMEYSKPLTQFVDEGKCGFNDMLDLAMLLWNHASDIQRGRETGKGEDIMQTLAATLKIGFPESEGLLKNMVERFEYLFPRDKQPEDKMTLFMFIRKELRTIIRPFDYSVLSLSDGIITSDEKDRELINKINQLDRYVMDETEYSDYEKLLFSIKDECAERFEEWLTNKGLTDKTKQISDCLNVYFDFIYAYMHDVVVTLKDVPLFYLEEFFTDFLLRKVYTEPNEYVYWPPALKLFYTFLHEKNYIDDPGDFIDEIDSLELEFLEVLKKQFT